MVVAATTAAAGMTAADAAMWAALASGLGAIGGGIAGLFNNPASAAHEYYGQIPETITPYYQPYIDTGLRSLQMLEKQFAQLIRNPQGTYNELAQGFQQSPGYQWNYDQAMNGANSAAAAGGYAGSNAHTQTSATYANNLAAQEFDNYFKSMLSLFNTGLSGTQGLNQMGYNASSDLATQLGRSLMAEGMIAAMAAKQKNSSIGGLIGGTVSSVGGLF